jgi:sialidase-1
VQMAELSDGTLMLNTRVQGGNRHRKIAYSKDAGNTWSQLKNDPTLIEPQCQASILRYSGSVNDNKGSLLFVNPASTTQRSKGTVRISYDDGITWPISKLVYPGPFAYSCLTVLKEGTVGILFERDGYKAISFMRVTLKQITDGHSVPK